MELTVDQAAGLLHVRPSTIHSRLRSGELTRAAGAGPLRVRLELGDYIRSEDAAAILGISPTTVRSAIGRGELAGKRTRRGRWTVRLESVLADPRAGEAAQAFSVEPGLPAEQTEPPEGTPRRAPRHDVFVRIDDQEYELLELAAARHGTKRAAVVAGLQVLVEEEASPGDLAELRADRDTYRDRCVQLERELRELAGLARRQVVDELYCPRCEAMVPIDGWGYARDEQTGTIELYHRKHGHQAHGRMRTGSIMARRRGVPGDGEESQPEVK